jgi:hypothetical protein
MYTITKLNEGGGGGLCLLYSQTFNDSLKLKYVKLKRQHQTQTDDKRTYEQSDGTAQTMMTRAHAQT